MTRYQNPGEVFKAAGVPDYIWQSIMQAESGGNPSAIGDNGTSYGLFQLHQGGGLGDGYAPSQLLDPVVNAEIASQSMAAVTKQGEAKGLTGYNLLQYVAYNGGWPTHAGVGALSYDPVVKSYEPKLQAAYSKVTGGSGGGIITSGGGSVPTGSQIATTLAGHLKTLETVQTGTDISEAPARIGYMVAIGALGLIFVFVGIKMLAGGSIVAVVKEGLK